MAVSRRKLHKMHLSQEMEALPAVQAGQRITHYDQATLQELAQREQQRRVFYAEQPTWLLPMMPLSRRAKVLSSLTWQKEFSLVQTLLKNSGIYALASCLSSLVTLALTPFLAYHLSNSEYGLLAVLTITVSLGAGLTQLGLGSAFFRSYNYDYESKRDRLGVVSTVTWLILLISLPPMLLLALLSHQLAIQVFHSPVFSSSLELMLLVILAQNLTIPGFAWLRATNRALLFALLSLTSIVVSLGTTLLFVGRLHLGVNGALLATCLSYGVVACATLPVVLVRTRGVFRADIARGLFAFGVPNVVNFLAVWVLELSDRYLLSHLTTLAQTASYAVAYSLGSALSAVVVAPFSLAWPAVMFSIARRDHAARVFQRLFRWYCLFLLFATFALALLANMVLALFFPSSYASGRMQIPIIALSMMLYGVYIVLNVGVAIQRKPWFAVCFTLCSAVANVVVNLLLIPRYGATGAALATLLAYLLLAILAYSVNRRLYLVPFEIGWLTLALLPGIVLYTASSMLSLFLSRYIAWGLEIVVLGLYGCYLLLFGRFLSRR